MHNTINNENYDSALKVVSPSDYDEQLFNDLYKIVFKRLPLEDAVPDKDNLNAASAYFLSSTLRRYSLVAAQIVPPPLPSVHRNNSSVVTKLTNLKLLPTSKTDNVKNTYQQDLFCQQRIDPDEKLHDEFLKTKHVQSQRESGIKIGSKSSEISDNAQQVNEVMNSKVNLKYNKTTEEQSATIATQNRNPKTLSNETPYDQEPLRPLSAYNYFFRDERERILKSKNCDDHVALASEYQYTSAQKELLLHEHWNQDRTSKRRHRKTHGKISFTSLSKMVSKHWKELPEEHKVFYKEVASRDWNRYQQELAAYKESVSSKAIQYARLADGIQK